MRGGPTSRVLETERWKTCEQGPSAQRIERTNDRATSSIDWTNPQRRVRTWIKFICLAKSSPYNVTSSLVKACRNTQVRGDCIFVSLFWMASALGAVLTSYSGEVSQPVIVDLYAKASPKFVRSAPILCAYVQALKMCVQTCSLSPALLVIPAPQLKGLNQPVCGRLPSGLAVDLRKIKEQIQIVKQTNKRQHIPECP